MNRTPAQEETDAWVGQMDAGYPREDIFHGFVMSDEFDWICASFGILRGVYTPPPGGAVRVFVTRLYNTALGRFPDEEGLQGWVDALLSGRASGADVAYGFIFSDEMFNAGLSFGQFVDRLYIALMGRPADDTGRAAWVARMEEGYPWESIFDGFVMSDEFAEICARAGINRGSYAPPPDVSARVFVTRIYMEVLGRSPDHPSLDYWAGVLQGVSGIGAGVAQALVLSEESVNRGLSNEQFVEALFKSLRGRDANPSELSFYAGLLYSGTSRQVVLSRIVDSVEFRNYCVGLGINPGRALDQGIPMIALTYDDGPRHITNRVLDIFESYSSAATFFVNGYVVDSGRYTVSRAFNMGNEIGNHGWSHAYMTSLSHGELRNSLANTSNLIQSITGLAPRSMRPTYGHINSTVVNVTAELGLPIILWSVDSGDGDGTGNPHAIANHVIANARHGSIVLLHDHNNMVPDYTALIVPGLINRGYQLVTVSELLFYSGITLSPGQTYR